MVVAYYLVTGVMARLTQPTKKNLNNKGIRNINKESANQWHDNKCLWRRTIFFSDRGHIGNGGGRCSKC